MPLSMTTTGHGINFSMNTMPWSGLAEGCKQVNLQRWRNAHTSFKATTPGHRKGPMRSSYQVTVPWEELFGKTTPAVEAGVTDFQGAWRHRVDVRYDGLGGVGRRWRLVFFLLKWRKLLFQQPHDQRVKWRQVKRPSLCRGICKYQRIHIFVSVGPQQFR